MKSILAWLTQPRQLSTIIGVAGVAGVGTAAAFSVITWPVAVPMIVSGLVSIALRERAATVAPALGAAAGDIARAAASGGAAGALLAGVTDLPGVLGAIDKLQPVAPAAAAAAPTQSSVSAQIAQAAAAGAEQGLTADQLNAAELAGKPGK